MRRLSAIALGSALAGGSALAAGPAGASTTWPSTLHATHALHRGERLVAPNGQYHAAVEHDGRLVVRTAAGNRVWNTPQTGANAYLYLAATGQLVVKIGGEIRWSARTAGSGKADVLTMRNDGVLALTAGTALVWSSRVGNGCPQVSGKTIAVDLSRQLAWMCSGRQQIRATAVTTGATALGYGTPTGTWHVQARVRDTTLYPAAGGAYPVHYWMPYDGPYGIHDSPWQNFPYGSSRYRTEGSHGCVHVPGAMMAWLFGWAPVGTRVVIHA
jgi:hypothetical protein